MINGRYEALDGLRGIAALIVVFHHLQINSIFRHLDFVLSGELFVDVFFVMSGFVIAASYLDRIGNVDQAKRFLTLRFFRIYPLHIFALSFFVIQEVVRYLFWKSGGVINSSAPFTGTRSLDLLGATTFLIQSWGPFGRNSWNGPSWSISSEALAYIVFALAVMWRPFHSRLANPVLIVGAVIAYIYASVARDGLAEATYGIPAVARGLAGFFIGVVCFRIVKAPRVADWIRSTPTYGFSIMQLVVVATFLVLLHFLGGPNIVLTVVPLVFLVMALHVDRGVVCMILNTRPMQYLGKVSYSIYLMHASVIFIADGVFRRLIPSWDNMTLLSGTLVSIGIVCSVVFLAEFTYRFIEQPGREYGRRLFRRPQGDVVSPRVPAE